MRKKAELLKADLFARKYAALLAVDAFLEYKATKREVITVIEAEDRPLWDDVVHMEKGSHEVRYQIKRQQTPLTLTDLVASLGAGLKHRAAEHHLVFPVIVNVRGVGSIHLLRGLCERIREAHPSRLGWDAQLNKGERKWVKALASQLQLDEKQLLKPLANLYIDIIGYEKDIDTWARRKLEPFYRGNWDNVWSQVQATAIEATGVVKIHPAELLKGIPRPETDELRALYWSLITECEHRFMIERWAWLTDNLVLNLVPIEFMDGVLAFAYSVQSMAWPAEYRKLASAIRNVGARGHEYVRYFNTRSEVGEDFVRENKDHKRVFPNPRYDAEVERARKWDKNVQIRLANVVVALNALFAAVRLTLDRNYRLRMGKLGIHDSMGHRNNTIGCIYYPMKYIKLR